jgi:MFS family permease
MATRVMAWARQLTVPGAHSLALLYAFDSLTRAALVTVIPLEVFRLLGSARDMSLLFAATGWGGILASLLIPTLIRRFPARQVYLGAAIMMTLVPVLLAASLTVSMALAILFRAFAGICLLNTLNLFITVYVPKQQLTRSEPLRYFYAAAAWTLGPIIGGTLLQFYGPLAAFGFGFASGLVFILYFLSVGFDYDATRMPGAPPPGNPLRYLPRFFRQKRLVLAWLINIGYEAWWVVLFVFGPVYIRTRGGGEAEASLLTSAASAVLFSTLAMGWLARRFGLRRFMVGWFLFGAVATLAAGLVPGPYWFVGFMLFLGAFMGVALDATGWVPFLRVVKPRERPEMTLVFTLYRDVAMISTTIFFSLLLSVAPLESVFVTIGIVLLACAWLARWIPRGM